jgi:hypothetical protein
MQILYKYTYGNVMLNKTLSLSLSLFFFFLLILCFSFHLAWEEECKSGKQDFIVECEMDSTALGYNPPMAGSCEHGDKS